jgi:hypothetical protein
LSGEFSGILGKLQNFNLTESTGKRAKEGDSPVGKRLKIFLIQIPEYSGTREILPEFTRTTS